MEVGLITPILLVSGYVVLKGIKLVRYKRIKKKLKMNLEKSVKEKDIIKIGYYITKLKDMNKKFGKDKTEKYLEDLISKNEDINPAFFRTLSNTLEYLPSIFDTDETAFETDIEKRINEMLRQNQQKEQGERTKHITEIRNNLRKIRKSRGSLG